MEPMLGGIERRGPRIFSVVPVQVEERLDRAALVVRPGCGRKGRIDRPQGWLCSHDKGLLSRRCHGFTLWELYPFYHGEDECGNRIFEGCARRRRSLPFLSLPPSLKKA